MPRKNLDLVGVALISYGKKIMNDAYGIRGGGGGGGGRGEDGESGGRRISGKMRKGKQKCRRGIPCRAVL